MAIPYSHKDAKQDARPAGDYEATLAGYEEKVTKEKQKPMMVLNWKCFENDGGEFFVKDYIVIPDGVWKVKKIALALGKIKEFEADAFQPEDQTGCSLVLTLGVQAQDGFDDKNTIKAYKPLEHRKSTESPALVAQRKRAMASVDTEKEPVFAAPSKMDDDCPF